MKDNQLSVVIPKESLDAAFQHIDEIDSLFPFLISLTNDEKLGGFKLGDKNVGFLTKGKEYMKQAPQFLPSFVNITESDKDINAASDLFNVIKKMRVLLSKFEDTATQAGFEALAAVLAYYGSVKLAAKNNVPGAQTIYEDLRKRFPGKPNPTSDEEAASKK